MRLAAVPIAALTLLACADVEPIVEDKREGNFHGEVDSEDPYYDELSDSLGTVAEQQLRCTTRGTVGLSLQIIYEMNCMARDTLVVLEETDDIHFKGGAVLPLFAPEAIEDIYTAAELGPIEITSGFRSVVQQHLIYQWYQNNACNIGIAARPGNSRHESGRAVDIRNWNDIEDAMTGTGWTQPVRGDEIHFEHPESADLSGLDVLAFQRLWNRNNPGDPIDEDGIYGNLGSDTSIRMDESPAGGFAIGADCPSIDPDLEEIARKALTDLPHTLDRF